MENSSRIVSIWCDFYAILWFLKQKAMHVQVFRSFGKNWRPKLNIPFELIYYYILKIHISLIQRQNHGLFVLMSFWEGTLWMWENLGHLKTKKIEHLWEGGCVMSILWVFQCQFLVLVSIQSCHQHVVEGCAMPSTNGNTFEFLS